MPRFRLVLPLILAAGLLLPAAVPAQDATPPPPCSAPEARQFDFWVGEWDLTWANGGHGTNVITSEMGGCVIEENFSGTTPGQPPFVGHSVSVWSPRQGQWRQTWVDNSGGYLTFEGGMEGDAMVLYGGGTTPDGKPFRTRMTFADITDDAFTWHWDRSTDDGETWTPAWKIDYRRKGSAE